MKRRRPSYNSSLDELKAYSEALSNLYALPEITATDLRHEIDLRVREAQAAMDRARGAAISAEFIAQLLLAAQEFKDFQEHRLTFEAYRAALLPIASHIPNWRDEVDCQSAFSCLIEDFGLLTRERGGPLEETRIDLDRPSALYDLMRIAWLRYLNLTGKRGLSADVEMEKAIRAYRSEKRGGRPLGKTELDNSEMEKGLQRALAQLASRTPVVPLKRPALAEAMRIDPKTLDLYLFRLGKSFRPIAKAFDDENLFLTN